MNWLFEFRVLPWDMGRFHAHELDAIERGLKQIADAAKKRA